MYPNLPVPKPYNYSDDLEDKEHNTVIDFTLRPLPTFIHLNRSFLA